MDTTEKVVSRVMKWLKLFGFFVGIPVAFALLLLGIFLQREVRSLHDLASTGLESVKGILQETRKDAELVQAEVASVAKQTRQQLADLKTEVGNRVTEVRQLNEEVQKSKSIMERLAAEIAAQSTKIKAVAQQVKTVTTEKNTQRIREAYPAAFGERYAQFRGGEIDPREKTTQDVWMSLIFIPLSVSRKLDPEKMGQVMTSLNEHKYRVFEGGVDLAGRSGGYTSPVGPELRQRSCSQLAKLDPPCILYFREALQAKAHEVRDLVRAAQIVPNDKIKFVDPKKLDSGLQESLERSALDIVLVLSA